MSRVSLFVNRFHVESKFGLRANWTTVISWFLSSFIRIPDSSNRALWFSILDCLRDHISLHFPLTEIVLVAFSRCFSSVFADFRRLFFYLLSFCQRCWIIEDKRNAWERGILDSKCKYFWNVPLILRISSNCNTIPNTCKYFTYAQLSNSSFLHACSCSLFYSPSTSLSLRKKNTYKIYFGNKVTYVWFSLIVHSRELKLEAKNSAIKLSRIVDCYCRPDVILSSLLRVASSSLV